MGKTSRLFFVKDHEVEFSNVCFLFMKIEGRKLLESILQGEDPIFQRMISENPGRPCRQVLESRLEVAFATWHYQQRSKKRLPPNSVVSNPERLNTKTPNAAPPTSGLPNNEHGVF